tara:strand:- start:57 stop:332 length:276 start_codon:yes stop_codon:yes gene_type:complete
MANELKGLNGKMVEMTDEEQAEINARRANYVEGTQEKEFMRVQRNKLLKETDTWALSDRTMTDAQKKYRQDLRDLPAQSGFPDVDFPTKPS